jgi:predicted metalloprotease
LRIADVKMEEAKLQKFERQPQPGPLPMVAAQQAFPSRDHRERYDANFCNLALGFFDELKSRFGAPGEFAQAYVIAHEIGHHVQKLLGIESRVQRMRQNNPSEANPLSVRLELQADCFAGVRAKSTEQRKVIDQSDVEAGLRAAASVGDDRLQKMATGHISPEKFTHGTSRQRSESFQTGLNAGQISACDTFGGGR